MENTKTASAQKIIDTCWHLLVLLSAGFCVSLMPDMAHAGGTNAIETVMCNVVFYLTGTTGKAVATVAIIVVGLGALLGKISWGMALIVALGVALIFGAASIVNALGGDTSSCSGGQTQIS